MEPALFQLHCVTLPRESRLIADAVDEVRFTMDSVFMTASERQTLEVAFPSYVALAAHTPGRTSPITAPQTGAVTVLNDNHIDPGSMFMEDILIGARHLPEPQEPWANGPFH
jgi:hypothetical protein